MEHTTAVPVAGTILAVDRFSVPSQTPKLNRISITTVLVAGSVGDYAAYRGHGAPAWVRVSGDKMTYAQACYHFADLEREKYRE